jgi:hypothetical protein
VDSFSVREYIVVGVNEDIVHINRQPTFQQFGREDGVHHHLEGGGGVCQSEEHNSRFEEALLVMNAAFHSSPGLMHTLLYPHRTSNFENKDAPFTLLISSGINGRG